jgi:hypothetical protein
MHFLASEFITTHELPRILLAAGTRDLAVLWVHVGSCMYAKTAIAGFQAAHDIQKPLKALTKPKRHRQLLDIAHAIVQAMEHESPGSTKGIENIQFAPDLGPSYMPNIKQQIQEFRSLEFVSLRMPWWNTRLHLFTALASDFTEIRQLVLLDAEGRFLTMAPPTEIRQTLAKAFPKLEVAYRQAREQIRGSSGDEASLIISSCPAAWTKTFG